MTRVVYNLAGLAEIKRLAGALLAERARAIEAACNADSSWGGYHSAVDASGMSARVWSADRRNDEARDQRLLRNLDAAR